MVTLVTRIARRLATLMQAVKGVVRVVKVDLREPARPLHMAVVTPAQVKLPVAAATQIILTRLARPG